MAGEVRAARGATRAVPPERAAASLSFEPAIARVPFDEGSLIGNLTKETRWPHGDWRNSYFVPENLTATVDRVEALALRDRDRWLVRREAAIATEVREAVIEAATRRIEEVLGDDAAARQLAGRVIEGAVTIEEVADGLICRAAGTGTQSERNESGPR